MYRTFIVTFVLALLVEETYLWNLYNREENGFLPKRKQRSIALEGI